MHAARFVRKVRLAEIAVLRGTRPAKRAEVVRVMAEASHRGA